MGGGARILVSTLIFSDVARPTATRKSMAHEKNDGQIGILTCCFATTSLISSGTNLSLSSPRSTSESSTQSPSPSYSPCPWLFYPLITLQSLLLLTFNYKHNLDWGLRHLEQLRPKDQAKQSRNLPLLPGVCASFEVKDGVHVTS